jgi:hypothetical protein
MEGSIMENKNVNGSCDDQNFDWSAGKQTEPDEEEFFRTEKPQVQSPPEELDLAEYRSGQSLSLTNISALPTKPKIEIRKPKKKECFRCHHVESLERMWIFEGDGIDDYYLVRGDIAAELPDEFAEAYLALCVNSSGRLFLWPIKCGTEGGQEFTETALDHANKARSKWIRRKWLAKRKMHRPEEIDVDEVPEWPEESMRSIISRAFGDKVIRSLDHPCLRFVKK